MSGAQGAHPAMPRRARARLVFALCLALACAGFFALGVWQVQRLHWKNALIARVDRRVHAAPAAAPPAAAWAALSKDKDEYRRLRMDGRFLDPLATRVQAVTELGAGFWVLTPFVVDGGGGAIVLVNRGFIPDGATPADAGAGPANIAGLLRMSERGGGFLRNNDPAHQRWYSRDAEAIGAARGLARVAPWFLDQDGAAAVAAKTGSAPGFAPDLRAGAPVIPVGGLTVISFHNSHLVYALTWFAMGLMAAGAGYAIAHGKI